MKIWEGDPDMEAYHRMEKELLRKHHGEVAVFCNGKLAAVDKDMKKAIEKAGKLYKKNTFFVKSLFSAEEQAEGLL